MAYLYVFNLHIFNSIALLTHSTLIQQILKKDIFHLETQKCIFYHCVGVKIERSLFTTIAIKEIISLFSHSFRQKEEVLYAFISQNIMQKFKSISKVCHEITFFSFSNIVLVFYPGKTVKNRKFFPNTHTATSLFSQKIPLSIDMQTSSCKDDDGDERCRKNCTDFNHIPLLPPPYMHVKVYSLIKQHDLIQGIF